MYIEFIKQQIFETAILLLLLLYAIFKIIQEENYKTLKN